MATSTAATVFGQVFSETIKSTVLNNTGNEVIQISQVGQSVDENQTKGPDMTSLNVTVTGTPFAQAYAVTLNQLRYLDPTPTPLQQQQAQTLANYQQEYGTKVNEAIGYIMKGEDGPLVMLLLPDRVVTFLREYVANVSNGPSTQLSALKGVNPTVNVKDAVTAKPERWWQIASVRDYPTKSAHVSSHQLSTTKVDTSMESNWSAGWWIFSIGGSASKTTHSFNQAENIMNITFTTGVSRVTLAQGSNINLDFLGAANMYIPGKEKHSISDGSSKQSFMSDELLPYFPTAMVVTANTTITVELTTAAFRELEESASASGGAGGGFFFSCFPIDFGGNVSAGLKSAVTKRSDKTVTLEMKTKADQPQVVGHVYSPVPASPTVNPPQ